MIRTFYKIIGNTLADARSALLLAIANVVRPSHDPFFGAARNYFFRLAGMRAANPLFIDHGFRCIRPENITIEHCVSIGHDNHIWAFTPVRIRHHTITAKDLLVISASHDVSTFEPAADQEVEIGPGCWIGARVTILGGVKIGRGCVIGAGSVVRTSLPEWSVAAGVPARIIRKRVPAERIWNHFGWYAREELEEN